MASQGWQPGDHLGVQGSAHSEFHTDANFSHIRVTIKDDNLGLGAKIGSGVGPGECTGLDAFQNLLGRLNGRDEDEIEKEQKSRDDLKRAIYAEQKWGSIRFVKGGLLIGDKIQDLINDEKERVRKLNGEDTSSSDSDGSEEESESDAPIVEERKSKKRKLEVSNEAVPEVVAVKIKKSKKRKIEVDEEIKTKKVKKSRAESSSASDAEVTEALNEVNLSKKGKKEKKAKGERSIEEDSVVSEDEEARRVRKQEKKQRKEEKRLRKQQAKDAEADSRKESKSMSKKDKKKTKDKDKSSSKQSSRVGTNDGTPATSGTSTPVMGGRHAVRARNIAQKRLAAMDVASLNQVSEFRF